MSDEWFKIMTIYCGNANVVSRIFILVMFMLLFEMQNYLIFLEFGFKKEAINKF